MLRDRNTIKMARDDFLTSKEHSGLGGFDKDSWRHPNDPFEKQPSPSSILDHNELQNSENDNGNGDDDDSGVNVIHSGHFMVSNPHKVKHKHNNVGYNFDNAPTEPSSSYKFQEKHNRADIDVSFSKLFDCMSLAYTGARLVSPKWKTFKGMKLSWKDKIRLNNAIWREWHQQFCKRRKPVVCHFAYPIAELAHFAPQAIVLEGKYWKRTLSTVVREYQKWRIFHRKLRSSSSKDGDKEVCKTSL